MNRLKEYLLGFFPAHLSRELRELYLAFTIGDLAVAAVMLFEPVYLYRLGYTIPQILFFFLCVYVLYLLLLPAGGALCLRYGYRRMIFVSSLFSVAYYLSLLGLQTSAVFLPLAVVAYALQKTTFWPSYHYDFAWYGQDTEEGREVSGVQVIDLIVGAIGPFLGGVALLFGSFTLLFVVASVLIVCSTLPLLLDTQPIEPQPFSYREAFARLLNPEKRSILFSTIGYGEELIALVLWPIFIYLAIAGNLFTLGSFVAMTTILTVLIILYVGRLTDQANKRSVLRFSALLYTTVWGLRLFVQSLGAIFFVDMLSRVSKRMLVIPQMSIIYERARERQHAMSTAILYEMGVVIGKISALVLTLIFFAFFTEFAWSATFVLAGLYTLLYLYL